MANPLKASAQRAEIRNILRPETAEGEAPVEEREEREEKARADDASLLSAAMPAADPPPAHRSVVARMEQAFGMRFDGVALRTDPQAATRASALDARAYTDGQEIGFAAGAFAPHTPEGLHTIAHEFAHVAQARGGTGGSLSKVRSAIGPGEVRCKSEEPKEEELDPVELDAEAAARQVVAGEEPEVASAQLGGVRRKPETVKAIARGQYLVAKTKGGDWIFYFNAQDVRAWADALMESYGRYVRQAFPGASAEDVTACARALSVHWSIPLDPVEVEKATSISISILSNLHQWTRDWFQANRPGVAFVDLSEGVYSSQETGTGQGGGAKQEERKALPPSSTGAESQELLSIQELYDYLRKNFPDHPIWEKGASLNDLLEYLGRFPDDRKQGGKLDEISADQWRAFLDRWMRRRPPREGGEETGSPEGIRRFEPRGKLLIKPDVGVLVTGSDVEAEVKFSGSNDNIALNIFPGRAIFDWTMTDDTGKEVNSGPWFEGRGDRTWSFEPEAVGRYTVSVSVTSPYFKTTPFIPNSVTFLVTTEAQREQEVFELLLAGPEADKPFEKTPDGEIKVKSTAKAVTLDDELAKVALWIGAVEGMKSKGEIPEDQAKAYLEVLEDREKELQERRDLMTGHSPYVAHGTFLDATSSAYTRLNVVLYGKEERVDGNIRMSFQLVDMTLAPDNPPVYEGAAEVPVGDDEAKARRQAEAAAIDALTGEWTSINDYPDGTGRLGVQLSDGSLHQKSFNTRNTRKTVKKGAGYVALGAGVVALGASAFTGGTSAPAGVVVLEVGAGLLATGAALTEIGIRLEERIRTETFRADRELLLDTLTVATTVAGLGGLAKALRGAKTLSNGKLLVGLVGLDTAQAMVIGEGVRRDILAIEGEYLARQKAMEAAGAKPEEITALLRERDAKIGRVLGSAAVTGALLLISLGKGVKDVTASGFLAKPGQAKTQYVVREQIKTLGESADPVAIRKTLETDPLLSKQETAYLEEALHNASEAAAKAGTGGPAPKVDETTPAPRTGDQPEPTPRVDEPEPTPKVEEAEPTPKVEEEPQPTPKAEEEPAPAPKSEAEPEPAPKAEPEPEPTPKAEPEPAPAEAKPKKKGGGKKKTETAGETGEAVTPAPEAEAKPKGKKGKKKAASASSYEPDPEALKKQIADAKALKAEAEAKLAEAKSVQQRLLELLRRVNKEGVKAVQKDPPRNLDEDLDMEAFLDKDLDLGEARQMITDAFETQNKNIGEYASEIAAQKLRIEVLENPAIHRAALPCFAAETPVWTAAGPVRIDAIQVGDRVLSFDFASRSVVEREVLQVFRNRTLHFFAVSWSDGSSVEATGRHRFWIADRQEWIEARDLAPGMECQGLEGRTLAVVRNRRRDAPEEATFNLQVDGTHNYFVGPGALVHNDGPEDLKLGGDHLIYRGTNENFPGKVYIGQTDDFDRRQSDHRKEAVRELAKIEPELKVLEGIANRTPEEEARYRKLKDLQEFFEFKKEMVLQKLVKGLDQASADYLEQRNIVIERKLVGDDNVMNRREQIKRQVHLDKVIAAIKENPAAARFCPA